jgi:hypothetical protein
MTAVLMVAVLGVVAIALFVDAAVVVGWLRGLKRKFARTRPGSSPASART